MEIQLHHHSDHFHVVACGDFDLTMCKAAVDDLAGRCGATGVRRVLIDCTATPHQTAIAGRFNLADHIAAVMPGGVRVAFLATTAHLNYTRTLENTANNRGALLLSTDSMESARAFLGLPAAGA